MEKKYHMVTWQLPIEIHARLLKLKGSNQSLGISFIEEGLDNRDRFENNKTIERENAELKVFETIDSCITTNHLKNALTYINLFDMAYGSSNRLFMAYKLKKEYILTK